MRPIKLTISAFGPYAGQQIVDFRDLKDRSFFLIHGRTGAGKTSLLDAICFALYGDTSGNERDGKDMRSHHADPSVRTEVILDFSIGKDVYRVARSPLQERPRKKGGGVTSDAAQATLWRRTGEVDDSKEGTVLASQPNKVSLEVERLLSFQSDQFRQVVILPQGQFRRLLMSESSERQEILEALFKTELYRRIEDALKGAARAIKDRWTEAGYRIAVILQQANVASVEELEEQRQSGESSLLEAQARVAGARAKHADAQRRFNDGLQAHQKLKELADAGAAVEMLERQVAEYEDRRGKLKCAQEATKLSPAENMLVQREQDLSDAKRKLAAADLQLAQATAARRQAVELLDQEETKGTLRDELQREVRRLDDLSGKVAELQRARTELESAELNVQKLAKERDGILHEIEGCESSIEAKQRQLREMESMAATVEGARQVALNAEKVLSSRKTLEEACDKLARAIVQAEQSRSAMERAGSELAYARIQQLALEDSWISGQAAILAQQLVSGKPCPVCGSADHPQPSRSHLDLPTQAEIDSCRANLSNLEKLKEQAFKDHSEQHSIVTRLQSQVQTLTDSLGDAALQDISELQRHVRETRLALADGEEAAAKLKGLSTEIEDSKTHHLELKQQQNALEETFKTDNDKSLRLAGIVQERGSAIPDELKEVIALERHRSKVGAQVEQMELALKSAQMASTTANEQFAVCERDMCNASELLTAAADKAGAAREDFVRQLMLARFTSEAEYRAAKMESQDIRNLEQDIRSFEASLQSASERAFRARQAAAGAEAPEVAMLEGELKDSQALSEAAVREESALVVKLEQINKLLSDLRRAEKETKLLEREFESIGRISEVANGNNGRKLTFQRFVLGALLDDVLYAASERLRIMSQGRYRLQRLCSVGDLRKAGGLELEVFDSYTGTTRAVATLSGGESFLASLSLALGLADVVQSYAGGVHLETMFIDEGFGSLDPESLDFAIRALRDLQKSGRLIGIISHVPELRERIDARLEVLPSGRGSVARISVG